MAPILGGHVLQQVLEIQGVFQRVLQNIYRAIRRHPCPTHGDPWGRCPPNPDWSGSKSLLWAPGFDKRTRCTSPGRRWSGPQTMGTPRSLLPSPGIDKSPSYNRSTPPAVSWTPRLAVAPFFDDRLVVVFHTLGHTLDCVLFAPLVFHTLGHTPVCVASAVFHTLAFAPDAFPCSAFFPPQFWPGSFPGTVFWWRPLSHGGWLGTWLVLRFPLHDVGLPLPRAWRSPLLFFRPLRGDAGGGGVRGLLKRV